ncbi:MAG: peroxiredoxin Q/BCP [Salibacteraceae bacterium]|jgi:peroxiredoxin Q/BCP|tara:strand:+ start:1564 stop:2016 length:453 start_codon:yes stop_codon:yes gene_type:complete
MTTLKAGDKAPDFSGLNEKDETISLNDFKGKKLVLYFYPKDMTPGCTTQSCNLRDNYDTLLKQGYEVLGVSADSTKRHIKFIEKYDLPFSLLADEDHTVLNAYGVWGLKKFMGKEYDGIHRTTFVIDENGIIIEVIGKVKTKEHAEQILG